MNSIRQNIGLAEVQNANAFLQHLLDKISEKGRRIEDTTIVIGYGGGKDSTWVVAFARLTQLLCLARHQKTFHLHIITMVHLGVPRSVFLNIHQVYHSLGLLNNSTATLELFCYRHRSSFKKDYEIPGRIRDLLRTDILLAGHRTFGNARAMFCLSCNLHLINANLSSAHRGSDFFLSGDSLKELQLYWVWLRDIFKKLGVLKLPHKNAYQSFANCLHNLNARFFKNLLPDREPTLLFRLPILSTDEQINPVPLSIFQFSQYKFQAHEKFLTHFLGFKFYEDAHNFTETDCQHPLLMAHLRGLTAEIDGREYGAGIQDYLSLAQDLMVKKEFSQEQIRSAMGRYETSEKINQMREKANQYAQQILGVTEQQLKCLLYSPFANQGEKLQRYVKDCHSEFIPALEDIHACLNGSTLIQSKEIVTFLESISGLNLAQLRKLYQSSLTPRQYELGGVPQQSEQDMFQKLLSADPHKKIIEFTDSSGNQVKETLFGR